VNSWSPSRPTGWSPANSQERAAVEDALRARFVDAIVVEDEDGDGLAYQRARMRQAIEAPGKDSLLPLDLRGSIYEISIWEMLRRIPPGKTASYSGLAFKIGKRDTRELMEAIRANPIAVLIPCHCALAKDGSLSEYRWGICRRRALLQRERERT
jgi:AraC family transcriptional regulator of adaptative response/methylated-DNA-[protein]-cysteine methyltransferase